MFFIIKFDLQRGPTTEFEFRGEVKHEVLLFIYNSWNNFLYLYLKRFFFNLNKVKIKICPKVKKIGIEYFDEQRETNIEIG